MLDTSDYLSFRKLVLVTVGAVYLLILVGGIVRSTGSGMGCPDWPKCFGRWIPPTELSQLPEDYKEHYSQKRKLKNEKIASFLKLLNFEQLAVKISGDKSIYEELDFNALKTWIEYLNRLTGVVIGLLIFAVLIYSTRFFSIKPSLFYLSLASFITVGFEGWLGSIVVSTNLLPFSVTIHMALALVLVGMLIYLYVKADRVNEFQFVIKDKSWVRLIALGCILSSFIQILLGTQVREGVDLIAVANNHENRALWIEQLGNVFKIHRSFSILVMVINLYLIWVIRKTLIGNCQLLNTTAFILLGCLILEITFGIVMAYLAIPSFSQPLHLLLGSLILGIQMFLFFYMFHNKKNHIISFAK